MSHLVRGVVREELSAIISDTLLAQWFDEDALDSPSKFHDEWDQLWTDVGGEA